MPSKSRYDVIVYENRTVAQRRGDLMARRSLFIRFWHYYQPWSACQMKENMLRFSVFRFVYAKNTYKHEPVSTGGRTEPRNTVTQSHSQSTKSLI